MQTLLYAGNSEYPFVLVSYQHEKSENQKVQTISREAVVGPSTTKIIIIVERNVPMNSISNEASQVILGGLLGDATINRSSKNPRLQFCHSPQQEEYILWKYEVLKNLTNSKPQMTMCGKDRAFPQLRFQTKCLSDLIYYEKLFYSSGKKVLLRSTLNLLEPLGLSIWYMDDGNLIIHKYKKKDGTSGIKSREIAINTQCFTYYEHEIIQRYFAVKWGIEVKIYKNKGSHRIVMNATNAKKFICIIEPFIIPSMKYKIDLQYTQ